MNFNAETLANVRTMTSTALREFAKEIGVKRSASDTKEMLMEKVITEVTARIADVVLTEPVIEVAPVEETPAEAPKATSGMCTICGKRRKGSGKGTDPKHAKSMGYCAPCLEEAEWENEHSDRSHETNGADESCWICHPELNEAQKEHVAGRGTSRLGMVMNTTHNQAAIEKANVIKKAADAKGFTSVIETSEGLTTITVTGTEFNVLSLGWDARGSYVYDASSFGTLKAGGKMTKVRNVAAALRLLAGLTSAN